MAKRGTSIVVTERVDRGGETAIITPSEGKRIPVKVVSQNGATALVEWVVPGPDWKRAYVPCAVVTPQGVAEDDLAAAEPYGIRWEQYMHLIADAAEFARRLRQEGIWTVSDLASHPNEAQGAINQAYQVSIRNIILAAKKET